MKRLVWPGWIIVSLALATYFSLELFASDTKPLFLVGEATHGHHQIELACGACHTSPFGGKEVLQEACVTCHGKELEQAQDSHPRSKFTDPRNADRVEILDARYCVTCHLEHQQERTHPMGLTLPEDYCFECHQDIAEKRPTHVGLGFETCASAGCHNYHDNLALYEDFLVKHAHQPMHKAVTEQIARAGLLVEYDQPPLTRAEADAPEHIVAADTIWHDWAGTLHATAGVNCGDCHQPDAAPWSDAVAIEVCAGCHEKEHQGFVEGRHGMRLADAIANAVKGGLGPMTTNEARIPMAADSHGQTLSCTSCHSDHRFDTRHAAVDACLGCHADEHSLAFLDSPHGELWQQATTGALPEATAVSCATCHLPRIADEVAEGEVAVGHVLHNQNALLRPNEKMIRPVCSRCHGVGFAIDALADEALIRNNFSGLPSQHILSIDMALENAK